MSIAAAVIYIITQLSEEKKLLRGLNISTILYIYLIYIYPYPPIIHSFIFHILEDGNNGGGGCRYINSDWSSRRNNKKLIQGSVSPHLKDNTKLVCQGRRSQKSLQPLKKKGV